VVLTGDVHAHWGADLRLEPGNLESPVVGSEFITSSITSGGDGYDKPDGQHPWAAWNPDLRFWTNLRGYLLTTITPAAMTTDYRCVPVVTTPDAAAFTRATYVVEDGAPGLQEVAASPRRTRNAAPSDEQIIADTIEAES
jgi:alkaline phosphatase D